MQKSIAQLTTVIYNHRGGLKLWIVEPPAESSKLEARIRENFQDELGKEEKHCSQFVKHLSLWITPWLAAGLGCKLHPSPAGGEQMVFFFPSSYYRGMSTGSSIVEIKAVTGKTWEVGEYRFCGAEYPLCEAVLGNGIVFWNS